MNGFDSYYKIYLDKNLQLAESVVIKMDSMAHAMNVRAYTRGLANALTDPDKRTWPYYLNLNGTYHSTDIKMTVISMDNLEQIEFNKENLELHTATKEGYQFGTKKYEELVERYPEQELLIFGILYPVDIDVAINATDGTILRYQEELIEENEYTLLDDIQTWVNGYFLNWYNKQYEMTDDLYGASVLAIFYTNLVPAIMMLRKRRCLTNEAHSYHVRRYLASHGFLDSYLDQFTLNQSLRFYKNIAWVERNIGNTLAQKWLIQEAMTARNLPIADYSLRHITSLMGDELYPEISFNKRSINKLESIANTDDLTLPQLLEKEEVIASGNAEYSQDYESQMERLLQHSPSSTLQTKVLESKVIDWTDAVTYPLTGTLLSLWLDHSSKGLFTSYVSFDNYKRNEIIPLPVLDAYILYWYLFWRGMGLELTTVPKFLAERVPLATLPVSKTIQNKMTSKKLVPISFIDDMRKLMVKPIPTISISAFYKQAKEINRVANLQDRYVTTEQHYEARAYKEGVTHSFYQDRVVKVYNTPVNYASWLDARLIKFDDHITNGEYFDMAIKLFKDATGVTINEEVSVRSVQEAMIRLMEQLSSYTVQYIKDINKSTIIPTGDAQMRTGYNDISAESLDMIRAVQCILDFKTSGYELYDNVLGFETKWDYDVTGETLIDLDLPSLVEVNPKTVSARYRLGNTIDVEAVIEPIPLNLRNIPIVPGISSFINAPRSLQVLVLDAWDNDYDWEYECDRESPKEPFSSTIFKRDLPAFKYQDKLPLVLGDLDGYDYVDKFKLDLKDLDGYDYQDKWIFPKVDKMAGFAYLREFNTVSLDTLITGDLSIFRDDYPLWKTLPNNSGNLNDFNWEVTKRKFDLLKINTELDGWERTPIEKVLIDISLAKGNLDGFTRLQLIDLADPDIKSNLEGFKIKDYLDISGTTTDKLEGFRIKTYLDISVDTNDKLDGLKERF